MLLLFFPSRNSSALSPPKLPKANCVSGWIFLLAFPLPHSDKRPTSFWGHGSDGNAIRTVQDPVQRFATLHLTLHSKLPC
jgi:hypothetical protein